MILVWKTELHVTVKKNYSYFQTTKEWTPYNYSRGYETKESRKWSSHITINSQIRLSIDTSESSCYHGAIIRTGVTCYKISCYMCDSFYRWLTFKNAKIFWSFVKHFWLFPLQRNYRFLIGLCKVLMNHKIMCPDWENKMKLVSAFFS